MRKYPASLVVSLVGATGSTVRRWALKLESTQEEDEYMRTAAAVPMSDTASGRRGSQSGMPWATAVGSRKLLDRGDIVVK
jgi:hypothetical protein